MFQTIEDADVNTPQPIMLMPQPKSLELQMRMQSVRAKRIDRVAEFQNEAERLTDWREHVKSAPLASLAGSTILGFFAIQSVRCHTSATAPLKPESLSPQQHQVTSVFPSGYFTNSLFRVVTSIVLSAGKSYLTKQLNSQSANSKI